WWTCEDLLKQMHQAIKHFNLAHPGCVGVFVFDQSSNHQAYAAEALVACRTNVRPGGKQ
ncbi:hypothetical protein BDK51DRAFT_3062, partial [Blyttiomyces helicus]